RHLRTNIGGDGLNQRGFNTVDGAAGVLEPRRGDDDADAHVAGLHTVERAISIVRKAARGASADQQEQENGSHRWVAVRSRASHSSRMSKSSARSVANPECPLL